jgi:hypothetical protein
VCQSNHRSKTPFDHHPLPLLLHTATAHPLSRLRILSLPAKIHDRFIPSRSGIDFDVSHLNLTKENKPPEGADERERKEYEDLLAQGLFDGGGINKVLNFQAPPPARTVGGFQRGLREVRPNA